MDGSWLCSQLWPHYSVPVDYFVCGKQNGEAMEASAGHICREVEALCADVWLALHRCEC